MVRTEDSIFLRLNPVVWHWSAPGVALAMASPSSVAPLENILEKILTKALATAFP
jgi:predicted benzoate:H+ symporter BenE